MKFVDDDDDDDDQFLQCRCSDHDRHSFVTERRQEVHCSDELTVWLYPFYEF